jgi:hypothetical protein
LSKVSNQTCLILSFKLARLASNTQDMP